MIEYVKDLPTELGAEPLPELEVLEHGEIHVLEARVAEDVPAHISEGSSPIGSQDRVAICGYEAATRPKFTEGGRASGSDSGSGICSVSGHAFGPLVWSYGRGAVRDPVPPPLVGKYASYKNRGP